MPDARPSAPPPKWQPSSPAVQADGFEDLIAGPPVIVHFWAPWNPYDKLLDANLLAVRKKFPKLRNFSANPDDTAFNSIVETYHVAALPALVGFANGRPRGRFHGVETPKAVEAFLAEMSQPLPR
jgi:thioredoxin-like negative regulator of GroEL